MPCPPHTLAPLIVGAGLSGLAAAAELGDRGKNVVIVDQEGSQNLGGQAHWSLGALFIVDTPVQRRMDIKGSHDLALNDGMGSAQFDRPEDDFPRQSASTYLDCAVGEMRPWLHDMGLRWLPVVGWVERGGSDAMGHGNSVSRFHITWGAGLHGAQDYMGYGITWGTGLHGVWGRGGLEHFIRRCREHVAAGRVTYLHRHHVDRLDMQSGAAVGVSGIPLATDMAV